MDPSHFPLPVAGCVHRTEGDTVGRPAGGHRVPVVHDREGLDEHRVDQVGEAEVGQDNVVGVGQKLLVLSDIISSFAILEKMLALWSLVIASNIFVSLARYLFDCIPVLKEPN